MSSLKKRYSFASNSLHPSHHAELADAMDEFHLDDEIYDDDEHFEVDVESPTPPPPPSKNKSSMFSFLSSGSSKAAPPSPTHHKSSSGLIWHAQVVSNSFSNVKVCDSNGKLKSRRPLPIVRADDFFGSLVHQNNGQYVFPRQLNDWPGLKNLT